MTDDQARTFNLFAAGSISVIAQAEAQRFAPDKAGLHQAL